MNKKWYYIIVCSILLGVALFAPYPQLFTQGNTECSICIGDCWSTMSDSCNYHPEYDQMTFLETYLIIYAICVGTTCDMEIDVTCRIQTEDGLPLRFYPITVGCAVPNCYGCYGN